jgi:hypothetical protein
MEQMMTRHVLHNDIWQAVIRGSAIMKRGDVGVFKRGQDLPLIAESRQDGGVVRLETQELESYMFAKLIIIAIRQEHRAHTTAAKQLLDSVGPKPPSHPLT